VVTEPPRESPPRSSSTALPANLDLRALTPAEQERLSTHWTSLRERGFEVTLRRDSIEICHPKRGFETVVQLSGEDDLGERREVFRALRAAFGSVTERWFPRLVQSSTAVTRPYQDIKEIVEICQALRRSAPPRGR